MTAVTCATNHLWLYYIYIIFILYFTFLAGNPPIYSYQWKYETQRIANQTGSEYRKQQIAYTDAGTYQCVASNYEGGTATADKTVVVYCE